MFGKIGKWVYSSIFEAGEKEAKARLEAAQAADALKEAERKARVDMYASQRKSQMQRIQSEGRALRTPKPVVVTQYNGERIRRTETTVTTTSNNSGSDDAFARNLLLASLISDSNVTPSYADPIYSEPSRSCEAPSYDEPVRNTYCAPEPSYTPSYDSSPSYSDSSSSSSSSDYSSSSSSDY